LQMCYYIIDIKWPGLLCDFGRTRSYMKRIENILLKACGYTVFFLLLFYVFGAVSKYTDQYIDIKTFLIILLFGFIISVAGFILTIEKIKIPLRILIHYVALFIAFYAVFIISGNLKTGGASVVFSAIVIFTFLYAIVFAAVFFVRKAVKKADAAINKKIAKNAQTDLPKAKYKSLYKNED